MMPSERVQRRIDSFLDRLDKALENENWQRALKLSEAALGLDEVDLAQLLIERDTLGGREKATELQGEAIAIATELSMKPLLERVLT
jgi:hypothetical protein